MFKKNKTRPKGSEAKQKDQESKQKANYAIKWTCTSDQSTVFLDVVKINVDRQKKMNWEMKFPIRFVICKFLEIIFLHKFLTNPKLEAGPTTRP